MLLHFMLHNHKLSCVTGCLAAPSPRPKEIMSEPMSKILPLTFLGKCGIQVSKICLGTMTFGQGQVRFECTYALVSSKLLSVRSVGCKEVGS